MAAVTDTICEAQCSNGTDISFSNVAVGGCFGTGLKLKGFLPIIEIHTKSLIYDSLPEDYTINLFVKKVGLPVANVSVILSLRGSGGLPQLIITCISNCARQFNSNETLELAGHCINCIQNEKLDFNWDISPVTDTCVIKQFDWAKYVIPEISLDRLTIRPNTFTTAEENDVYKVTLTGESILHFSHLSFLLNKKTAVN